MFKLAILGAAAIVASATSLATTTLTSCGNGNVCPAHSTCVSTKEGAGRKWACAPVQNATICGDERYSCPSSFSCNATSYTCYKGSAQLPMFENGFAQRDPLKLQSQGSICGVIGGYLPSFCQCQDRANYESLVSCGVDLFGYDTVTVVMDIAPCASRAYVDLSVHDSKFGVKYDIGKVAAGTDEDFDIPGLSIDIPGVPVSAGVVVDVKVDGNIDNLELQVGVDACAQIPVWGKECGSDLTSVLPVWLLDTTFNFGHTCSGFQQKKLPSA